MRVATPTAPLRVLFAAFVLASLPACSVLKPAGYAAFQKSLDKGPPLQVYDTLETLIANEEDTRGDRKAAFRAVRDAKPEETAAYHFAWAGVAGRLVQQKGLLGADLLHDIEKHARRSVELDPDFRAGAATRLLGTMYVVAPSTFLEHGDSELGLEMLETLVAAHPADHPVEYRYATDLDQRLLRAAHAPRQPAGEHGDLKPGGALASLNSRHRGDRASGRRGWWSDMCSRGRLLRTRR